MQFHLNGFEPRDPEIFRSVGSVGQPYELKLLPFPPRFLSREYLQINPLGTVPYFDRRRDAHDRIGGDLPILGRALCWSAARRRARRAYLNALHMGETTLTFPQTLQTLDAGAHEGARVTRVGCRLARRCQHGSCRQCGVVRPRMDDRAVSDRAGVGGLAHQPEADAERPRALGGNRDRLHHRPAVRTRSRRRARTGRRDSGSAAVALSDRFRRVRSLLSRTTGGRRRGHQRRAGSPTPIRQQRPRRRSRSRLLPRAHRG